MLMLAGTLGASNFLTMTPDAVVTSFAGCDNAVSRGTTALILNPAGLTRSEDWEAALSHLFWTMSASGMVAEFSPQYEYAGGVVSLGRHSVGMNIAHYHYPPIDLGDGNPLNVFSGFLSGGYAYDLGFLSAGVRGKVIWEVLASYSAAAFAFDAGVIMPFTFLKLYKGVTPNCRVGIALYNVGTPIVLVSEPEYLPGHLSIGAGYTVFDGAIGTLDTALDGKFFWGSDNGYRLISVHAATEYRFRELLSLRMGYAASLPIDQGDTGSFSHTVSAGVGASYRVGSIRFRFDYAVGIPLVEDGQVSHTATLTLLGGSSEVVTE